MFSLALVRWAVVLISMLVATGLLTGLVSLALFVLMEITPQRKAARERRHHARRTARAVRRMTEIRHRTAERMDRAEERRRP